MANITGLITFNNTEILEVDAIPSASTGTSATIGSLASFSTGTVGTLYLKTGSLDTAWDQVSTFAAGNVGAGLANQIPVYDANGNHLNPTVLQNGFTVGLAFAASGTRSANLAVTIPNPGDAVTAANVVLTQGAQTIAGALTLSSALNMSNQLINNVLDPVSAQDAATKNYVDATAQGLSWKQTARAATTANITLSAPQTIDGVSVIAGDRVLVKNQTTQSQNGIYVVAAGAWTRALDMVTAAEFVGAAVFIDQGTINSDTAWVQITNAPITVGTSNIVWTQFAGAGTYTAGSGLTLTGTQFSANVDNSTTAIVGNNITVKVGGITDTYVSATAAIQYSKLAALAINSLVVSNGSGFVSASAGTGFVRVASGVVSYQTTVSLTADVSGILPIANGGTNSGTALTNNRLIWSAGGQIVEATALTNGQLFIGSTGAAPVAATLTAGANAGVTIVNAAGSITLSTVQDIRTSASPTFVGLTLSGLTAGSVIFAGAGGAISQNNAAFFWDNTNSRLGLGNAAPATTLDVTGAATIRGTADLAISTLANGVEFDIRSATVNTTDATVTTVQSYTVPTGTSILIQARVLASRTGGTAGTTGDSAAYIRTAKVKNIAGTLTLTLLQSDYTAEDQPAWNTIIDVSGTSVRVRVSGAANNNITFKSTCFISQG